MDDTTYKVFDNPLPPKFGRMYVGNDANLNHGPAVIGDTVTISAGEETSIYILVENSSPEIIQGKIVGIGPNPTFKFDGWSHGDSIEVRESSITAIIRAD